MSGINEKMDLFKCSCMTNITLGAFSVIKSFFVILNNVGDCIGYLNSRDFLEHHSDLPVLNIKPCYRDMLNDFVNDIKIFKCARCYTKYHSDSKVFLLNLSYIKRLIYFEMYDYGDDSWW